MIFKTLEELREKVEEFIYNSRHFYDTVQRLFDLVDVYSLTDDKQKQFWDIWFNVSVAALQSVCAGFKMDTQQTSEQVKSYLKALSAHQSVLLRTTR